MFQVSCMLSHLRTLQMSPVHRKPHLLTFDNPEKHWAHNQKTGSTVKEFAACHPKGQELIKKYLPDHHQHEGHTVRVKMKTRVQQKRAGT